MKLIKHITKPFKRKNKELFRNYQIGPYSLLLPKNHKLDSFQKRFPRYDYPLGEITRILHQFYPGLTAIDIGANIGDTAALISKYHKIPVLCIEGAPQYIEILYKNIKNIHPQIFVKECFLGTGNEYIPNQCNVKNGTFSLVTNPKTIEKAKETTATLAEVIDEFTQFSEAKLIKVDTDGFDFKILLAAMDQIHKMQPVLFLEYDISFNKDGYREAQALIDNLYNIDYRYFLIYDNFGNFLFSLDGIEKFEELNLYLLSNKYHSPIISYYDVCAFPKHMHLVWQAIKDFELSFKKNYIEKISC